MQFNEAGSHSTGLAGLTWRKVFGWRSPVVLVTPLLTRANGGRQTSTASSIAAT